MNLSQSEIKEFCKISVNDKDFLFYIPNGPCLWRVQTIKAKEPWTLEWIDTFCGDDIFWDVGANIGIYTIYAAVMKGVRTFAFEPEASNYRVLNENIRINKIADIAKSYCLAVSDRFSFCDLNIHKVVTGSSNHQITQIQSPAFSQGTMTLTLDMLCNYLPPPTKLKIDVDGVEPLIINGALETALSNVDSIMIELYAGGPRPRPVTYDIIPPILYQHGFKEVKEVGARSVHRDGPFEGVGEFLFTR